jgi:hypothetical protein
MWLLDSIWQDAKDIHFFSKIKIYKVIETNQ